MAYVLDSDTGTRLAKAGYAVHGIDYEGHGKSSGLQGYIPSFKNLVEDCSEHFTSVCGTYGLRKLKLPSIRFKFPPTSSAHLDHAC